MSVRVSFDYTPDDPAHLDPEHKTGLSVEGHDALLDALMQLGAENIEVTKT